MSHRVRRAEGFYIPPPPLTPDAWDAVPAAERVARWIEIKAQCRIPTPPRDAVIGTTYARIDAGRWVADCTCGSAQVASPDDPAMYCVDCRPAGWLTLAFPVDVAAAEIVVADLPAEEQFWRNPEEE